MRAPEGLKELFKMFPFIKYATYVTPMFVSENDAETEKSKERIRKFQEDMTKRIIQNTKNSIEGKGQKARHLRLATEEELRYYENMNNNFINQIRLNVRLRLLQFGTPKFKRNYLRDLGANVGERVMITFGNTLDVIFPQFLSIGDDTVFGMGSCVMTHQFYEDDLYIGPVEIGKNVLIGAGAIISPGVKIGDNSIITPGVVHYDVPPNTLCVGLPEDVRVSLEGKKIQLAEAKRKVVKTGWDLHDWRQFMPASIILAKNVLLELQKLPMSQNTRQYLLRLAGLKIGKNVVVEDNVVFDAWYPENITIEDGAHVKRHAVIACHEGVPPQQPGEKGSFRVGEVRIGKNVLIESGSGILPGVYVGDNAEVLPYTFIATDVKEGIQVVGIPSRKVGETFDIENFLMQQFGYSATIWDEIQEDRKKKELQEAESKETPAEETAMEEKIQSEDLQTSTTEQSETMDTAETKSENVEHENNEIEEDKE